MARAFFTDVALLSDGSGDAFALAGVQVTVTNRSGAATTIYSDSTSGAVKSNPFTTLAGGDISFWAEFNSYNVAIVDSQARIPNRTIGWDAVPYAHIVEATSGIALLTYRMNVAQNTIYYLNQKLTAYENAQAQPPPPPPDPPAPLPPSDGSGVNGGVTTNEPPSTTN